MSQRTAAAGPGYDEAARAIRAKLLACRGAQLRNAAGCHVITQGGQSGADQHRPGSSSRAGVDMTLAEAKAQLGFVRAQLEQHVPAGQDYCAGCALATGPKGKPKRLCAEGLALNAEKLELQQQIRTWFDPPPGSAQLF